MHVKHHSLKRDLPSAAWIGGSYKGDIKMNQNRKRITYVCVLLLLAATLAGSHGDS